MSYTLPVHTWIPKLCFVTASWYTSNNIHILCNSLVDLYLRYLDILPEDGRLRRKHTGNKYRGRRTIFTLLVCWRNNSQKSYAPPSLLLSIFTYVRMCVCMYVCMYVCVYVQDVSKNLYGLQRINFVVLTKSHLTLMHALYTYTHI